MPLDVGHNTVIKATVTLFVYRIKKQEENYFKTLYQKITIEIDILMQFE